ncbi:hypothetical protein BECAL_01759 [Bellilinea caldifistulae]|jgi:hypothetical protein|uniref:Uncharacterized protein n=1 Tax=Bellilinea caldifistulae TaxID=360411 RepID=A0A0P6X6F8_9CHLR|nr:hypothetical protein [Bellilinea caldifistulae]KPL74951.1 hypothetical protein AC812_10575 [Bellilinea caldifistulae]GAP10586.1 hypothetical protein BECAL_01759 [Bellilinea caldifistulae]
MNTTIIQSLNTIEDLIESARKMVDYGEYTHDPEGFTAARSALNQAITHISEVKQSLKSIHEAIVQERV